MLELSIRDFSVYLDGVCIVNELNANFTTGTFIAILGNNGVGKTSLLKSLYGSLPYQGQAFFCGKELSSSQGNIAYLSQSNFLGFDILVSDFLVMSKYKKSAGRKYVVSDYESGFNFLQKLGCQHLYNKMFFTLSEGEQQLIWLAQTLNSSSELLLLDEPCQCLDVKNRIKVYKLLSELALTDNRLIICVSHDVNDLEQTEGSFLNLNNDQLEVEIISSDSISRAYKKLLN